MTVVPFPAGEDPAPPAVWVNEQGNAVTSNAPVSPKISLKYLDGVTAIRIQSLRRNGRAGPTGAPSRHRLICLHHEDTSHRAGGWA